jgi:hypothetical protein
MTSRNRQIGKSDEPALSYFIQSLTTAEGPDENQSQPVFLVAFDFGVIAPADREGAETLLESTENDLVWR